MVYSVLQTFQNRTLAHAVKESSLNNLITELLLWLLDERVPRMDDGGQLLKALNVLMLKILVNLIFFPIVTIVFDLCSELSKCNDNVCRIMLTERHHLLCSLIYYVHWTLLDGQHQHQMKPLLSEIKSSLI